MSASNSTVVEVARVLRKHLDARTIKKVVDDLLEVPGNKSFRDSVQLLADKLTLVHRV